MQLALNERAKWTKQWAIKTNANKTTFSVFSLSTKIPKISLFIDEIALQQDDSPTYLGITFDQRLTWKQHLQKAETKAKTRLSLMRKLAGSTWGADSQTLKKMYTGYVRPVMEYGMTAWCTSAKSHTDRLNRIQNQASRIITGGLKSTPIIQMENVSGLHSLDERREAKVLTQAAKFTRHQTHPMRSRMESSTKYRLKRESFLHSCKELKRNNPDLAEHEPVDIPIFESVPTWKQCPNIKINTTIPHIKAKSIQSGPTRRALTTEYIEENFPPDTWIRIYTDGSSENATCNGGAGILIQCPTSENEEKISIPAGAFATHFKSEATAIQEAILLMQERYTDQSIVILTDALSVLQALNANQNKELNELKSNIAKLSDTNKLTLQWIPSHCDIYGNEEADKLAKLGSKMTQNCKTTSYSEEKILIKANQQRL